eukprot:gene1378-1741_t
MNGIHLNINNNNNSSSTNYKNYINDILLKNIQQLEQYKELSELTLEQCDESFVQTKRLIIQDFDTLMGYLNERKIELLTQLAVELESHKQDLERNRDKAKSLIEMFDRKLKINNGEPVGSLSKSGGYKLTSSISSGNLQISRSNDDFVIHPKTDQMSILKEEISVIEWDWQGEFQPVTTKSKVIKSPRPLSPYIESHPNPNNSGSDLEDQNGSINETTEDSVSNSSISSSSNSSFKKSISSHNIIAEEKELYVFGKLEFKTKSNEEYKELNSNLPVQNYIYSIGGKLNGFDQYSMEKYDFKEGAWRSVAPINVMDNDFTSHYDGRNHIYTFGGSLSPTRIMRYDILEDRWESLQQQTEIPEGGRFLHSSVFDNKQFIYLIGGFPRSTHILKFNIITLEFTKLTTTKNLWNISTIYNDNSNSIYLIGGCNISRQSVDIFERYDIEEDRCYELPPLLTPMYNGGAVYDYVNGFIYVFGGFNSQKNECLNRVERFNIQQNKWEYVEPCMPVRMTITNSCFFDGNQSVYIVGGYNPSTKEYIDTVFKFNLTTFEWESLPNYQHSKQKGGSSVYISK